MDIPALADLKVLAAPDAALGCKWPHAQPAVRSGPDRNAMLKFRLTPHPDYLLAHIGGLVSVPAWQRVLQELEAALAPLPGDRLAIDLMALLGWLGVPERQAVGALMAAHLARMSKVALVIQQHKITNVVRDEAQRHGLTLRLFTSHSEAGRWVLS